MTHKLGLLLMLILLLSQTGLLGLSYFSYFKRSPGEFFAALPTRQDLPLQWLDRPSVSTQALLNWAALAATATFTIDFVNYQQNVADLKEYFTEVGYSSFLTAITEQGALTTINERKLVVTAVAIGTAVITREEQLDDTQTWTVEVPITVTYLSVSAEEKQNKLVTMTITQVPTKIAPKGIGIDRYVARDLGLEAMG